MALTRLLIHTAFRGFGEKPWLTDSLIDGVVHCSKALHGQKSGKACCQESPPTLSCPRPVPLTGNSHAFPANCHSRHQGNHPNDTSQTDSQHIEGSNTKSTLRQMINTLSMINFKSWQKIAEMPLSPITGLFGTNSSGKTSILQLLLMLRQTTESTDRSLTVDLGSERSLVQLGSFEDVVHGHRPSEGMSFGLNWTLRQPLKLVDPENPNQGLFHVPMIRLDCCIAARKDGLPRADSFTYGFGDQRFTMKARGESNTKYQLQSAGSFKFKRWPGRAWDLPSPVKCYGFPDQVYSYFQNAGWLAELQLAFEETMSRVFYLGPLREFPKRSYSWSGAEPADMGQRGERAIDALLAARSRENYIYPGKHKRKRTLDEQVAMWLKELGLIDSFSVKRIAKNSNLYEVKVRRSPSSPEVLITDVGFGVSQVLPVLVLCYYVPEGSVVILEQPEIHLHPSVQSGLADVFIDAIRTRGIQVILESHSEHLLRRLQRRIAEETLPRNDICLYFCDVEQGRSRLSRLELDLFGNISNWPKDFFGDEFGEMKAMTEAAMKRHRKATT